MFYKITALLDKHNRMPLRFRTDWIENTERTETRKERAALEMYISKSLGPYNRSAIVNEPTIGDVKVFEHSLRIAVWASFASC